MSQRERRLILIMAAIFAVYFLPFILWPAIAGFYTSQTENIRQLRKEITRYERLDEQGQRWEENHAAALQEREQVEASLLQGDTRDVVGARLQSTLRNLSGKHELNVRSMDVPEFAETDQWLMVSQSVNFTGDPAKTLAFLRSLQTHKTFLAVIKLDLRAERNNQVNGNVTVTGFSHLLTGDDDADEEEVG